MERLNLFYGLFPQITPKEWEQLERFSSLLHTWNEKVNLISRKDIDNLASRHVIPSLAVAKVCEFSAGSQILDVGTGGGFPGIPLAILFPKTQFTLVDSIEKKIKVVEDVIHSLELSNVKALHARAESLPKKHFDMVLGRAVTALPQFLEWVGPLVRPGSHQTLPNGVLYLKGGDFTEELKTISKNWKATVYPLTDYFEPPLCAEKCVLHITKL